MRVRAIASTLAAFLLVAGAARADLYVNFKDGLKTSTNQTFGCHVEGSTLRCTNHFDMDSDLGKVPRAQGYRGYIWASYIPYGTFEHPYTEHPVYPSCEVKIWREYLSSSAEHRWHIEVRTDEPNRIRCWYHWHSNGNSANTVDILAQKIR